MRGRTRAVPTATSSAGGTLRSPRTAATASCSSRTPVSPAWRASPSIEEEAIARLQPARSGQHVACSFMNSAGGDLFSAARDDALARRAPLAERLRPTRLDDVVGQDDLLGADRPLRSLIETDRLSSVILWGPAGTGKTTLARLIARSTEKAFESLSAVNASVKDVREVIARAEQRLGERSQGTILFLDEVHRFNKAQQDALLPSVESGLLVLVGATTENPHFEVNPPLLSRSTLFRLQPLTDEALDALVTAWRARRGRGHRRRRAAPSRATRGRGRPPPAHQPGSRRRAGAAPRRSGSAADSPRIALADAEAALGAPLGALRQRRPLRRDQRVHQVASAAATRTPGCTGSPPCSKQGRTPGSSPGGW